MYKNPAIFIDAFIRDQKAEDIFLKNLPQLKKLGIPILLLSNTTISNKIQSEVNYFLYDNNDLKFKKIYENYETLSHYTSFGGIKVEFIKPYTQPYGLSVIVNHYKCVSVLDSLGHDVAIKFEWDIFYDDRDLENIKSAILNFKNGLYNKGYFQCGNPPPWIARGSCVEGFFWMTSTKFFLENFPKLLCEDDYDNYLTNVLKDRSFLTDARFLYKTLVDKFKNDKTVETDPTLCEIKYSTATEISPSNYPPPCSNTTIKYLFKTMDENEYVLFSYNKSYINNSNPNWETIEYKIETKKQNINITHNVNTEHFHFHNIKILPEEFPIKFTVSNDTITYANRDEIVGSFSYIN